MNHCFENSVTYFCHWDFVSSRFKFHCIITSKWTIISKIKSFISVTLTLNLFYVHTCLYYTEQVNNYFQDEVTYFCHFDSQSLLYSHWYIFELKMNEYFQNLVIYFCYWDLVCFIFTFISLTNNKWTIVKNIQFTCLYCIFWFLLFSHFLLLQI